MLYRVFESDNVKVKDPIYFSTSFDNLEEALQWFNDLTDTYKDNRKSYVSLCAIFDEDYPKIKKKTKSKSK